MAGCVRCGCWVRLFAQLALHFRPQGQRLNTTSHAPPRISRVLQRLLRLLVGLLLVALVGCGRGCSLLTLLCWRSPHGCRALGLSSSSAVLVLLGLFSSAGALEPPTNHTTRPA